MCSLCWETVSATLVPCCPAGMLLSFIVIVIGQSDIPWNWKACIVATMLFIQASVDTVGQTIKALDVRTSDLIFLTLVH